MKYGYGTSSVKVRQGRKVARWKNTRIERLHDAPPLMLIISNTHQNVFNLRFHFESYRKAPKALGEDKIIFLEK